MAGWHHRLGGHEFEWTLGVGDGQGGLACCDSWGCKESDTTEWLNWTELKHEISLKKIRWRHQKCYIVSPLFQKLQLHQWGCYNKYIICFQQSVLATTSPTDDVFKRKPSVLILGNSLDLYLVLFCCIILYPGKNTSGTVNHLYCEWAFTKLVLKRRQNFLN